MTPLDLAQVRFDERGLVPVVAQEATTGEVLMLAWANREALERALATGRMHYWSRSRNRLWMKGEESGHEQVVQRLSLDCDGDAIHALVHQVGPACHTGSHTCFGRTDADVPRPALAELAFTIRERKLHPPPGSYTAKLLQEPAYAARKITEEAGELVKALAGESPARVASEAADALYHTLAACYARGVGLREILEELERRRGAERRPPTG